MAQQRIFNVVIDDSDLAWAARQLRNIPRGVPRAAARAINHEAKKGRTQVYKMIARNLGIPQKYVKRRVRLYRATQKTLMAKIWMGSWRWKVYTVATNVKQTRTGVSFKVAGKYTTIPHGFIATMPSGHTGVFKRVERMMKSNPKRQAIEEQMVRASATQWRQAKAEATRIMNDILGNVTQRFRHQVEFLMQKQLNKAKAA